jgi:hypothetical protein
MALACYPPSWKERYGAELADLARDGDTLDLLVGAARAWLHPVGERTSQARRLSAISTVHVSWCVAYIAGVGYLKAVNDPAVPGLTSGASQPLWAVAKATFFGAWLVLLITGTALLLRIGIPAARRRDWHVLRPMLPATVLLVLVLGTIPALGAYGSSTPAGVMVILGWLGLGLGLVVAGAIGPVIALRRSELATSPLRLPLVAAALVTVLAGALAIATSVQAGVLSSGQSAYNLVLMWGSVAVLVGSASTSAVSMARALRSGRSGTMVGDEPRRPAAS